MRVAQVRHNPCCVRPVEAVIIHFIFTVAPLICENSSLFSCPLASQPCQLIPFGESPAVKNPSLWTATTGPRAELPRQTGRLPKRWLRGRPERKVRTSRVSFWARKGRAIWEYSRRRFSASRPRGESKRGEKSRHQSGSGKKIDPIILLEFEKKKKEKLLWKISPKKEKPKAFPDDGIERDALEKGCSEASSSVQHTQTQTHVVPAVEDGFNQLHIMTHTHSSV